ncbi:nucleoid-structuring protein H-NS [Mycobacterium vicinigordonae]|uniref:Nucleoid-structuring protein H-NS n=1 Tax=Mycobacterium vicinigordonae TaxID=1719132 RepID=A0A7D6DZF0_9MYCO|nr:nucleoid-structuring protein H-NS [Mycobacterium vicinigordonae]QLL07369.1 nucleoid-structuring protein H-NS [Mycobacterium vicinigordonae]
MADPQDPPEGEPAANPPAKKQPAKKAPVKAAKAPAKKAPAKKAPAKKAPAKKAPAKKAPAEKVQPPPPPFEAPAPAAAADKPAVLQQHAETNGQLEAAKDAAAQAKSTVEKAQNPLPAEGPEPGSSQSPVPWVVAVTLSLLALLLVRQLRRR